MAWIRRRTLCGTAWLVLAILCTVLCHSAMQAALPSAQGRVSCRFTDSAPALAAVETLRKRIADSAGNGLADAKVTAWTQQRDISISYEATAASMALDALWIDGDASVIWNWHPKHGSLPSFTPSKICAIDTGTALRLFGSTDCLGMQVRIGDTEYTIECVFDLPSGLGTWGADTGSGLALCPALSLADPPKAQALDLTITAYDGKPADEWVSAWLNAAGISSPERTESRADQLGLLNLAAQLPAITLALLTAFPLLSSALVLLQTTSRESAAQFGDPLIPTRHGWRTLLAGLFGCAALFALTAAALLFPKITIDAPPSYLPTRWSDLSYWPSLMKQIAQLHAQRAMAAALRPDMIRDHWITLSSAFSLLCAPLYILAWRALRQGAQPTTPPSKLALPLLAACIALPLALLAASSLAFPATLPQGLLPSIALFTVFPPLLRTYPPAAPLKNRTLPSIYT